MNRILFTLLLTIGLLASQARAQLHAVPLAGRNALYEMDGYSVLAPQGKDWFELKRDQRNAYFGKKIASRTHSFIAVALSAPINGEFNKPEEFRDYVNKMLALRTDDRHSVLENQAEVDGSVGRFCVKYYMKGADRDALFAKRQTLFAETFGISCLHPDNPKLSIDVSYTERGHPAEFSADLRVEGESFVRSLKLLTR